MALELDRCDCMVIHEKVVAWVREQLPGEEILLNLADMFTARRFTISGTMPMLRKIKTGQ
ncbi:MAG: hypothetical protein LBP60_02525 [Spirochaetaceae bacterium]|nr:hypothetical protein [Spirochaetaceae bacterium]